MSRKKYIYQSYDYSFLRKQKNDNFWTIHFPSATTITISKTIGFDLATVEPMNAPIGQLFWIESVASTTTTSSYIGDYTITNSYKLTN